MIESQIEHIVNAVRYLRTHTADAVEPRADAQAAFVAAVDKDMEGTVWTSGGCKSWYLDPNGRNSTLWPGFTFTFKRRVERFNPSEYVVMTRRTRSAEKRTKNVQASCPAGGEVAHV